jgi:hypothetical protein
MTFLLLPLVVAFATGFLGGGFAGSGLFATFAGGEALAFVNFDFVGVVGVPVLSFITAGGGGGGGGSSRTSLTGILDETFFNGLGVGHGLGLSACVGGEKRSEIESAGIGTGVTSESFAKDVDGEADGGGLKVVCVESTRSSRH